jgi:hypothetical protein
LSQKQLQLGELDGERRLATVGDCFGGKRGIAGVTDSRLVVSLPGEVVGHAGGPWVGVSFFS